LKGAQERAWLERIEDELDNLRAAVTWSLASGDTRSACRCVCALGLNGLRIEPVVAAWADSIVACEGADRDAEYPAVLAVAAWARMGEGRSDEATRLCEAALEHLAHTEAPAAVVCRVMESVAGIEPQVGQNPTAHAQQWLRAAQDASDEYETALARNIVAIGQYMAGDRGALATAEDSLRAARRCGSPTAIAYCCFTTAMVCSERDPDRALSLLDESQRSGEAAANTFALITTSAVRAGLLSQAGDHHAAAAAGLDAARDAFRYSRREQQANALFLISASLAAQRSHEPAAVIRGWVHSVLGSVDSISNVALTDDAAEALARLPANLGDERYITLHAQGGAMSAEEILEYAHHQINRTNASRT